jgi:FkbM family methyltransferase
MEIATSHSQLGQDRRVAARFGAATAECPRYFVEVGASDGVRLSNTLALERDLGWRGVCVEPVPAEYEALCRNRPLAFCSPHPLADRSGAEVSFNVWTCPVDGTMLSGIAEFLNNRPHTHAGTRITMRTETLPELLDRAGAPHIIDYLSLDTEGSELAILQGLKGSPYRFRMIHVEHNSIEPRRSEIRAFLEGAGYRHTEALAWDDEYGFADEPQAKAAGFADEPQAKAAGFADEPQAKAAEEGRASETAAAFA